MPWFKVEDKLHSHKKAARAGVDAILVITRVASRGYAQAYKSGGISAYAEGGRHEH